MDLARRKAGGHRGNGAVGQPGLMRTMNLRAAFEIVAAEGPVAATRLVQGTGLSKPTVSEVLRQLLDFGLIARAGRTSGQVGPAHSCTRSAAASGVVIGVDVGYEWVRVVSADLSGKVIARADERARRRRARDLIEQVGRLVEQVAGPVGCNHALSRRLRHAWCAATRRQPPRAWRHTYRDGNAPKCSVAFATWSPAPSCSRTTSTSRPSANSPAAQGAASATSCSCRSAPASAWASSSTGGCIAGPPAWPARSATCRPSEPTASTQRPVRRAGQGAMERLVSSHAVIELAKEAGLQHATSAAAVIDAARAGDPAALRIVAEIAARLAFCIASVAAVLDPELVILGGGIGTGAGPLLLEPLRRNLAAISPLRPRLGTSELGSAAVVDGAVTEALRLVVDRIFDVDGPSAPVVSTQAAHR